MRTSHRSRVTRLAAVVLLTLGGCHVASVRQNVTSGDGLSEITPRQLFAIALHHAGHGDLLRAEQYLVAAKAQGLEDAALVYWLVRVCVSAGRYHSALRHASNHLRSHPGDWGLRLIVASIHEALGDLESARFELEALVRAEPLAALPHFRLASVYRENALFKEDATHHYRRYLELDPDGPHASESRAALGDDARSVWRRVDASYGAKERLP